MQLRVSTGSAQASAKNSGLRSVDFNSGSANFTAFRGPRLDLELSVLVVSGDEETRSGVAWVLKLFGCKHVLEATTAQGAVALIEHMPNGEVLGLVFCDLPLTKDILSNISRVEGTQLIPILMICEKRFNRQEVSSLLGPGVVGYVAKPLRIQNIRGAVVKHILQGAAAEKEIDHEISSCDHADYERMESVGKGAYGEVFLVRRRRDGICFAMKEMSIQGLDIRREKQVLTELRLHTSFNCPFIVRTFSAWLKDHMAHLLMEYVESGPLSRVVSNCRRDEQDIPNESIISWCGQMLIGLMYLHQKEVLHRDLKLDNILGPDSLDRVRLSDFGISRALAGEEQPMSIVGTPMAMAPERIAKETGVLYGTQSDLWSLGVVLYELATLHPPFEARDGAGVANQLLTDISFRQPEPLPYARSEVLHRIVTGGLLQKQANARPTCSELCQEPSISAAIHSFLARHDLLDNPAVLEVINILPDTEDAAVRIDTSAVELSQMRSSDVSRYCTGSYLSLSPKAKKTSETMPNRTNTLSSTATSGTRAEQKLAEAKWRLDELSKELLVAKNECVRLRRPMEVAQQHLSLVAQFCGPDMLRWSLRFAEPGKEAQYLRAHAPQLTLRAALGVPLLIAACGGTASLSRKICGQSHSAIEWWEFSGVGDSWQMGHKLLGIFFGSIVAATLAMMLLLLCGAMSSRNDKHSMLVLRELTAAGLLSIAAVFPIFSDGVLELQAAELCLDTRSLDLTLAILALVLGPRVLHLRWFILMWIHAAVFVSYAVTQFSVDSTGLADHERGGLLLTLLAALCIGVASERRMAERGERLRFLISSSSENIGTLQTCLSGPLAESISPTYRSPRSPFSPKTRRRAGYTKDLNGIVGSSTRDLSTRDLKLARSTSSLMGLAQKLRRATSADTTASEDMFCDFEDATDAFAASASLLNIRKKGEKEQWLLDATSVRILQEKVLGCGGFGVVMQGELFGAPVAVKMPKNADGQFNISDLSNELRVLRHVWHPNIVKFFGSCIDPGSGGIVVVLELLKGAQLDHFVCDPETSPNTVTRRLILLDICRALCYMHAQKPCIVHGDLKGSNILVESWLARPRTKLLDFGLSRLLTRRANPLGGTVNWMAPEIIRGCSGASDGSADVFSFGRLAFMVVTGSMPLRDVSCDEIINDAMNLIITPLTWPSEEMALVPECRELTGRCLRLSALMRPSMEEALSDVRGWLIVGWRSEAEKNNLVTEHVAMSCSSTLESTVPGDCDCHAGFRTSLKNISKEWGSSGSSLGSMLNYVMGRGTSTDSTKQCIEEIMVIAQACNRLIDPRRLDLMPGRILGVNIFGYVVPGQMDGCMVAVRQTKGRVVSDRFSQSQELRQNLKSLMVVKHPCIAALHGLCMHESSVISAVFEWVEGVPLEIFVCSANVGMGRVLAGTRHRLLLDIASALWYLHEQQPPIAHGRLKGSNIIVESRLAGPRAKLLDFGLSGLLSRMASHQRKDSQQVLPSDGRWRFSANLYKAMRNLSARWSMRNLSTRRRKELVWSAPEALRERHAAYTTSADVFVFGRLSYLVVTGREPFASMDVLSLARAARRSEVVQLEWPDSWPELDGDAPHPTLVSKCRPLCERCCIPNPLLRPSMDGVFHGVKQWIPEEQDYDDALEEEIPSADVVAEPRACEADHRPTSLQSLLNTRGSTRTSGVKYPSNLQSVPEGDMSDEDYGSGEKKNLHYESRDSGSSGNASERVTAYMRLLTLKQSLRPRCPYGHNMSRSDSRKSLDCLCNFCNRQLAPEGTWWSCDECSIETCGLCASLPKPSPPGPVGPLFLHRL